MVRRWRLSPAPAVKRPIRVVHRARLRMQGAGGVTLQMRAVLHGRGDLVMQIIAGPAMLDDRVHYEFQLEAYA